jgi:acyl-CoA reductase-like NAD-dependent aldehyde dehydrogenase
MASSMYLCNRPIHRCFSLLIEDVTSWNHGQCCCAGSRIFVQSGIYDEFLKLFTAKSQSIRLGDPFADDSHQGPQVSQIQFDVRTLLLSCIIAFMEK